jgi:alkanesulfonate monooxygenase SsuD/methylene tetrahydromethanopterin reductase-like flavin-dependent oxidoreductase (luciferase family)
LWTQSRSNFSGRYYQLSDAPLDPKPVQKPHPELMIGGGGERVTLRIVAKHADHWNVWGGPKVLARKSAILEEHCRSVGRDSKTIARSVNMVLLITERKEEVDRLAETISKRLGSHADDARDTCLAGPWIRFAISFTSFRKQERPHCLSPRCFVPWMNCAGTWTV